MAISCRITTENPIETGRGILETAVTSFDLALHYPPRTILKTPSQYFLITGTDLSLKPGTMKFFTTSQVTFPIEETDPSTAIPLWVQILYYAFPNKDVFTTITTIHSIANRLRRNETIIAEEEVRTLHPILVGKAIPKVPGIPTQGLQKSLTRTGVTTLREAILTVKETHLDRLLQHLLSAADTPFPQSLRKSSSTILFEELFIYFLYGKALGYQKAIQQARTDQTLRTILPTLLYLDGFISLEQAQQPWEELVADLTAIGFREDLVVEDGLLHALHSLVPVLKFLGVGGSRV